MVSNAERIPELKEYNQKARFFLSLDRQARANRAKGLPYSREDIMCAAQRGEFQSKIRANEAYINEAYIRDLEFQQKLNGNKSNEGERGIVRRARCPREAQCSGIGFCHYWRSCFFVCDETGQRRLETVYYECDKKMYKV